MKGPTMTHYVRAQTGEPLIWIKPDSTPMVVRVSNWRKSLQKLLYDWHSKEGFLC